MQQTKKEKNKIKTQRGKKEKSKIENEKRFVLPMLK